MPNSIDNKIVEMQFDNANFEKNVRQSIKTLEQLNKALELDDAAKGFEQMEKAADSIDLSKLTKAAEVIEKRFSAAGIAGAAVINRTVNGTINLIGKLGSTVVGLAKQGGINRALKLEHANFMLQGLLKNTSQVAAIMNGPVNNAVSGTAYGLDAAANVAAQLVASGVKDLTKLENALTAVSGVAAMTSSTYEEMGSIFTTVAGQGKVMTMQLRQIEARGLNAAAALGKYLNKSEAEIRDMVTKGQIDFETFAEAMNDAFGEQAKKANETFTGALSNVKAALSRIGAKIATPALEGLRKIFVSLISVINEVNKLLSSNIIASIAEFIEEISESLRLVLQSQKMLGVIKNIITGMETSFNNLVKVLSIVKRAFKNIFPERTIDVIYNLTSKITELKSSLTLTDETAMKLQMTFQGLFAILDIIATVVSQVIGIFVPGFAKLNDGVGTLGDKILWITGFIGFLLTELDDWIKKNNIVKTSLDVLTKSIKIVGSIGLTVFGPVIIILQKVITFFGKIATVIIQFIKEAYKLPIVQTIINDIKNAIIRLGNIALPVLYSVAGGFSYLLTCAENFAKGNYLNAGLDKLESTLNGIYSGLSKARSGFKNLFNVFNKNKSTLDRVESGIVTVENTINNAGPMMEGVHTLTKNVDSVSDSITVMADTAENAAEKTKLTMMTLDEAGKIFLLGFGASIISASVNVGRAFHSISNAVKGLKSTTDLIKAFINNLNLSVKIKVILSFAACIAVLAGSLALLTILDPVKLLAASAAITVLMIAMSRVAMILTVMNKDAVKNFKNASSGIVQLASAMLILAAAIKLMSTFSSNWTTLAKAIGGLIATMYSLAGAIILIGRFQKNAIKGSLSIVSFAAGVYLVMKSLQKIQMLDLDAIEKAVPILLKIMSGMVGLAVLMSFSFSPFGGFAFASLAIGIAVMFRALENMSGLDPKVLYQVEDLFETLADIIRSILLIMVAMQALKTIEAGLKFASKKLTTIGNTVNGMFKGMFALANKGIKYIGIASIIISIASSIYLIAESIIRLSVLSPAEIAKGAVTVTAISVAVTFITTKIIEMAAQILVASGAGRALTLGLMGISSSVLMAALSVKLIADMDETLFLQGVERVTVLEGTVLAMVGVLQAINKLNGGVSTVNAGIKTMAGIALMIGTLTAAVAILSFIPWQAMIAPLITIGVMLAGIAVILHQMAALAPMTTQATVSIGLMMGVFISFGAMGALLAQVNPLIMLAHIANMVLAVFAMGSLMNAAQAINVGGAVAVAAMVGVIAVMTGVAVALNNVDWKTFLINITILEGAIAVLGLITMGLAALAGPTLIGEGVLLGLAAAMAAFGGAAILFAVAATIAGAALNIISSAVIKMADIDISTIASGLLELAKAITLLSISSPAILLLSVALISFTASLTIFAGATMLFTSSMNSLINLPFDNLLGQFMKLGQAVDFFNSKFLAFTKFMVIAPALAVSFTLLGVGVFSVSAGLLGMAVSVDLAAIGFASLSNSVTNLATVFLSLSNSFTSMINSLKTLGKDTISTIFNELTYESATWLYNAGKEMMVDIEEGFRAQMDISIDNIMKDIRDGFENQSAKYSGDLYACAYELSESYHRGLQDPLGAYCDAEASVNIVDDVNDGFVHESENVSGNVNAAGEAVGDSYGSGLWDGLKGWLSGIADKLKSWWSGVTSGSFLETGASGFMGDLQSQMKKYTSSLNSSSYVGGRSLDFDSKLKSGKIQYVPGVGYVNTTTGAKYKDLINGNSDALDANQQELYESAAASGAAASATGGHSAALEENSEALDTNTEVLSDVTEGTVEETAAADDARQAILDQAEAIEVITEKFDELLNYQRYEDSFKIVSRLSKVFSSFWSNGLNGGFEKKSDVNKSFNKLADTLNKTTKYAKKGVYAFNDNGKYLKKLSAVYNKNGKKIENQVLKTGRTLIKVTDGQAKIFEKAGSGVEKYTIRVTKNIKNMGKQIAKAKTIMADFANMNIPEFVLNTDNAETFINKLRDIQDVFVKKGSMPKQVQEFLGTINFKMAEVSESMNILGKNIDNIGNYMSKKSQSTAYVQDAFISLAATLYDGSDAANEYATEHAKLLFLLENGEATEDEVAAHFESYIKRITDCLVEYRNSIEDNLRGSFDVWSEFDKNLLDDGTDLISNIESQIAGVTQWSAMLMELSKRGMDMNILKVLTDEGTSSYGKLKELLSMTADELALFTQRYKQSETAITTARDTALAALANATTRASQRAASKSGKISLAQLKVSKKAAKEMIDDAKAVADNQARYNSLTKKEEKKYLASLTVEEQKAYKKRLKAQKKALKAEKKAAAREEAKRAEESRVSGILEGIKSMNDYLVVMKKYYDDSNVMNKLNEQIAEAFEDISGAVSETTVYTDSANNAILRFAESLDDTGTDGLNYFEELIARVKKFMDEVKSAITNVNLLTTAFGSAEKTSIAEIYENALSNVVGDTQVASLLDQMKAKGYTTDVMEDVISTWKSDRAKGVELMKTLVAADEEYIQKINAAYDKEDELATSVADKAVGAMASTTGKSGLESNLAVAKQQVTDATKTYNDAVSKLNTAKDSLSAKQTELSKINRLNALMNKDQSKLTKKEKKELKSLKKAYADFAKKSSTQRTNYITKLKQEITTLQNDIATYSHEVSDASDDVTAATEAQSKAQAELNDYLNKMQQYYDRLISDAKLKQWFDNTATSVDALKDAMDSLNSSSDEFIYAKGKVSEVLEDLTGAIAVYNDADSFVNIKSVTGMSSSLSVIEDGLLSFGETLIDVTESSDDFWESLKKGLADYQAQLKSTIASSSDFFSMFSGFADEDNPLTATNYLEYADSQIEALNTWQENLKKLADMGLNKEILEKFAAQGLSSYEQVNAWVNASADQIGEYNKQWEDYNNLVESAANSAMAAIGAAWSKAGQSLQDTMISSFLANGSDRLTDAGYEASAMIISGVENGLTNAMPELISAVEKTSTSSIATAVGKTVGAAINQGLVTSITATVTDTVSSAIEKFKMAVDSINEYISNNLPTDYTITIHVDTSEMDAAIARMNAAVNGANIRANTTSQAVTDSAANQQTVNNTTESKQVVNNVTYEQTINSPTAMNQVEIYRESQAVANQIKSTLALANG